ncbi:MAG TPA: cell surface protein SprA [Gemmatimonadaceae bacterium]
MRRPTRAAQIIRHAAVRPLLVLALAASWPASLGAQEPVPRPADTTRARPDTLAPAVGVRPPLPRPRLELPVPEPLRPLGRFALAAAEAPDAIAASRVEAVQARVRDDLAATWGQTVRGAFALVGDTVAPAVLLQPAPAPARDTLLPPPADLGLALTTRIEAKAERDRNERCSTTQIANPLASCGGSFQPQFDFQFGVRTGGVVADRVHLDVDYDSEREFDASNNISIWYEGRQHEILHRLEVGNVSFQLPPSRFITSGIPSGNYGVQAIGQLGPMRFRAIAAQQKGNVVRDRVFTIGDRTLQTVERELEDHQFEPRRFFWTVDPGDAFPDEYPNIDILDAGQMASLAASLPDTARPRQVYVYRLLFGGQPADPNGPRFVLNDVENSSRGQVYTLLQEGVDYYIDPSQLWIALVRPLGLSNERLVVAFTTHGPNVVYPGVGGTPDLSSDPSKDQRANLVWDPSVQPGSDAFDREIRSVYRLGGTDVRRQTVRAKVVAGSSGDQEKPVGGTAESYLQMFGLSQRSNASAFDVENRLWPRPSDANLDLLSGAGADGRIIRDYFVVFPSLEPFAARGLVQPGNPANDTLYRTPSEDLYSSRRPQTLYRVLAHYESTGGGDAGTLLLGAVQLRQGSERILVDGIPLVRNVDYTVDYDLGRVTFARADTLFPIARTVTVRYEENPLFAEAPTNIFGLATEFPSDYGTVTFTAIQQTQKTTFTRPQLGFEPASALVAGVGANFTWEAGPLSRFLDALPMVETAALSRINVQGEFATSRPQPNSAGQAYVESFEGEGGVRVAMDSREWLLASRPAPGAPAAGLDLPAIFTEERATTLAWQPTGYDPGGFIYAFRLEEIDPRVRSIGRDFAAPEQMLWLTLYPLTIGGQLDETTGEYRWRVDPSRVPFGVQRWRSIRTVLSPTGQDLTRVENIEFWTLVDTAAATTLRNPTFVLDFGEISENSLAIAPETLTVTREGGRVVRNFDGRQIVGLGRFDSERDPFSQAFNVDQNDVGIPGDLVDEMVVVDDTLAAPTISVEDSVQVCTARIGAINRIGDTRDDCTVGNARLDEEDIDLDRVINFEDPASERILRYVVDLNDRSNWYRLGRCIETLPEGRRCWVNVRIPFTAADDTVGDPLLRRIRALRLTMISGAGLGDDEFSRAPVARLRLVGAPWVKRDERPLAGIGGDERAPLGTVIATLIGTQDSTAGGLAYEPPPGVSDRPEQQITDPSLGFVQINEQSMRLLASQLEAGQRAEAYYRFPEGDKNFMGYQELRVWARGRGAGWGDGGELEFFVKIGRDADNFYLRRAPAYAGSTREAWRDITVRFQTLFALRADLQNAFLQNGDRTIGCTGVDLALIEASSPPPGRTTAERWAACRDGYIVYTYDPNVTPPNLAAVQELAVGMVRVADASTSPTAIAPGDTLELWVDDIRLGDVVDEPGYAGQIALNVEAADVGSLRINLSRQDPNFHQLGEHPSFLTRDALDVATSLRLDKFLPARWGIAAPLTMHYTMAGSDPYFVSRSDIRGEAVQGLRTPRTAASAWTLRARKSTPIGHGIAGALLDNVVLTATWASSDTRSEYQTGGARSLTAGLDYAVAPRGREWRLGWLDDLVAALPGWMQRSSIGNALRGSAFRWNPAAIRLTSEIARSSDHRVSYLKPAAAAGDDGTRVEGLTDLWRTGGALELRPFESLGARMAVSSLRDLRDYGLASPTAVAASAERGSLFGTDVGLERERTITTGLTLTPAVASWLRPRFDAGTQFSILRDPNAPQPVRREGESTDRLPRRLTSSRTMAAGATVDLARAVALVAGDSSLVRRIAGAVLPLDVNVTRSDVSAFDGLPFTPGWKHQLALGGSEDFREIDGALATTAGRTTSLSASNAFNLPFGTSLTQRFQRVDTRSWVRRLRDEQSVVDGRTVTFPDVNLRWNWRPGFLDALIASIGAQVGARRTEITMLVPTGADEEGRAAQQSRSLQHSIPVNATIAWNLGGDLTTSAGFNLSSREDERPGSHTDGDAVDWNAAISRSFRGLERWKLQSDIRTRIAWQVTNTTTFVDAGIGSTRSRLADNGRRALNLNADTDVTETMNFSLQAARIVTFDRNYDRRFTQTVIAAVLSMRFFAGELR